MIKIENVEVVGLEPAIRGMRNPMNSWDRSDSYYGCEKGNCVDCDLSELDVKCHENSDYIVGQNDIDLMKKLAHGGPVHAKYRRMIVVYLDITAPLYWWKEFDTYKVGTVANSCSTMHKIHEKEFTLDDFSHEHLLTSEPGDDTLYRDDLAAVNVNGDLCYYSPKYFIKMTCDILNKYRELYLKTQDKKYWWQMIQLLPSSYNQRRTVMLNYEVLVGIYKHRKDHKLDEWRDFCRRIVTLPYSELIIGRKNDVTNSDRKAVN